MSADVEEGTDVIRAVLFDLGGVVTRNDQRTLAVEKWSSHFGLTPTELVGAIYGGNDYLAGTGVVAEEDWWRIVRDRLHVDDSEVDRLREELFAGDRVDDVLVNFTRQLRPERRTAFVSNAWSGMRARLEGWGLLDVVDDVVISAEVGAVKPDPEIYAIALRRLGISASEAVFVDDAPPNVEAAVQAGMVGVVFETTPKLMRELAALLGP